MYVQFAGIPQTDIRRRLRGKVYGGKGRKEGKLGSKNTISNVYASVYVVVWIMYMYMYV